MAGVGRGRRWLVGSLAGIALGVAAFPATAAPKTSSGRADLSVGLWQPRSEMTHGEQADFEVIAHNAGPSTARAARLTITVSGPAPIVTAWPRWWSCSSISPVVCSVDEFAPDGSETVRVRLQATGPGSFTLHAEVVATERDPAPAYNSVSHTVDVAPGADLMAVSTEVGGPTASITHTITNNGPAVATGVRAVIEARGAIVAVPGQGTCEASAYSWWWTCDLGVLANGQSVDVQVDRVDVRPVSVVPVNGGPEGRTGAQVSTGSFSSAVGVTSAIADPNPSNNHDGQHVDPSTAGADIVLCTLPGVRSLPGVCWHPF